ncbi:hypothetical protein OESDEN_09541 [Oesophagostomum dentatum]|uniref:Uncharacterized protein n=1 Tax=Oesophagostomum dentatum TaxID=61180 RepID=A0A0B1T053_OESDE|nr:hypothetical protein OESDEN_09541 [Oesophagostomum dentatum]
MSYVRFSKETQKLPVLDPKNKQIKRIVAVGYDNVDLTDVVGKRGVAVGVPYYYKDSDVDNVVKAIQGKYKPTPRPPTTTRRPTTSRPSTTPKPRQILKCLFVADLFNFGKDGDKYHDEAELINSVGYDFFTSDEIMPSAGLAISTINSLSSADDRINCIVFFSAQRNTQSLPVLNPENQQIKRIVAVGFDSTDLTRVAGNRGIAVSVPYYWKDSDVENIMKAIEGKIKPVASTTRKPTTRKPSTTPKPRQVLKCLFIGDLYNFGKDADKYVDETELIQVVGYDFFTSTEAIASAGLWAYGYTTFPKSPDLSRVNATAIEVINNLPGTETRINCVVLFSAQNNTQTLPALNPQNKEIKRIVAVGYDSTDLTKVVGGRGVAVSVPFYWKDSHAQTILNAILGK